jgi:hypothetical protein
MFGMFVIKTFDSKVINDKRESDWTVGVVAET